MKNFLKKLKSKKGQGLVEYALIIALIAVVAIAALTALGGQICTTLTDAQTSLAAG